MCGYHHHDPAAQLYYPCAHITKKLSSERSIKDVVISITNKPSNGPLLSLFVICYALKKAEGEKTLRHLCKINTWLIMKPVDWHKSTREPWRQTQYAHSQWRCTSAGVDIKPTAIMIPENAGGNAPASTIICNVRCSNDMPYPREAAPVASEQLQEGVISNFGTELEFMCSQVNPAANTATPELAFAIRLKVGPMLPEFLPQPTPGSLPEQCPYYWLLCRRN